MKYPIAASDQLRPLLRALRKSRGLNQTQVGKLLGVNQKRVAVIEKSPGVTGFDQLARLVSVLGGRLVIEAPEVLARADSDVKKSEPAVNQGGARGELRDGSLSVSVEGCLD